MESVVSNIDDLLKKTCCPFLEGQREAKRHSISGISPCTLIAPSKAGGWREMGREEIKKQATKLMPFKPGLEWMRSSAGADWILVTWAWVEMRGTHLSRFNLCVNAEWLTLGWNTHTHTLMLTHQPNDMINTGKTKCCTCMLCNLLEDIRQATCTPTWICSSLAWFGLRYIPECLLYVRQICCFPALHTLQAQTCFLSTQD